MTTASDYTPFGALMASRSYQPTEYRYGFNGMEKDDEMKGSGNSYSTEFRQYDSRLGRWLSIDPLFNKFPHQSPYVAFDNNPVLIKDPRGLEGEENNEEKNEKTYPDAPEQSTFLGQKGTHWGFANDWEAKNAFADKDPSDPEYSYYTTNNDTKEKVRVYWDPNADPGNGKKGAYIWQKPFPEIKEGIGYIGSGVGKEVFGPVDGGVLDVINQDKFAATSKTAFSIAYNKATDKTATVNSINTRIQLSIPDERYRDNMTNTVSWIQTNWPNASIQIVVNPNLKVGTVGNHVFRYTVTNTILKY